MSPQIWLIAVVVYLTTAIGTGFFGFNQGVNSEKAKQLVKLEEALAGKDAAEKEVVKISAGFELIVAHLEKQRKETERKWRNELNKPVYTLCKPDAGGLLQLNQWIDETNNSRKLGQPLPRDREAPGGGNTGGPDGQPPESGNGLRKMRQ